MEEMTSIISPDMAVVEPVNEAIDYTHDECFRRMGRLTASQVNGLAQIIPSAAAASELGNVYKVVYPAGINGSLISHNGGFLSVMSGVDGKIVSHATFVPLKAEAMALGAFSAMSAVTGQYYLHEINQELKEVQHKLDMVLDFLYDDKACELYAEAKAVAAIYENYNTISQIPEQLSASIRTIQQAKITAEKNIQFYDRSMNKSVDSIDPAKFDENVVYSLRDALSNYGQAINLYGVCSILEVFLSKNFQKSFLSFIEKDLKAHVAGHTKMISKLEGKLAQIAQIAGSKDTLLKKLSNVKIDKLEQFISDIQKQLGERSPVRDFDDVISQVIQAYTQKAEFRVTKDGVVYQKIS